VLDADPHCLGHEVTKNRVALSQGREQGFRSSPRFGEFFAAVKSFFAQIEEMKHYPVRFGQTAAGK
jgi:hypothetical protein